MSVEAALQLEGRYPDRVMSTPAGPTLDPAYTDEFGPFRTARTLAKLTTFAFIAFMAGTLWQLALSFEALSIGRDPARLTLEWASDFDARLQQAAIGSLIFYLVNAVFFSMWTYRVAKNAHGFRGAEMSISPGWAVGYYYVPIVSLWRPYQAIKEIWVASIMPGESRRVPPWWLPVWWIAWVGTFFINRVLMRSSEPASIEEWVDLHGALVASNAAQLLSAVMALAVVWQLTRLQERHALPSAKALGPASPASDG